jgi:hypothetical protein
MEPVSEHLAAKAHVRIDASLLTGKLDIVVSWKELITSNSLFFDYFLQDLTTYK